MFPGPTVFYVPDHGLGQTYFPGYVAQSVAQFDPGQNLSDLSFRGGGVSMAFPSGQSLGVKPGSAAVPLRSSAAHVTISHVVGLGSDVEMLDIDAGGNVAFVKDAHSDGNRTPNQDPSNAMSPPRPASEPELTMSVLQETCRPLKATCLRIGPSFAPESVHGHHYRAAPGGVKWP